MEYMDQKGYSDKEEEEEEEEDQEEEDVEDEEEDKGSSHIINNSSKYLLSPPSYNYGSSSSSSQTPEAINFMDLSLQNTKDDTTTTNAAGDWPPSSEREHMFDKVVTPSDVGKLNRLVIPKQHAEKYFPLDSSTNDKGLLLNFQDRVGKPWRFRYSYWNSSQSYVMTKGWSRFVKDKKLDAGDIVSFERSVRDSNVLYIDWRRRPSPALPPHHHHPSLWGAAGGGRGRFYSLQRPMAMQPLRHHEYTNFPYNIHHPYHQYQYHPHHHQMNPYQLPQQQYYHRHGGGGISPAAAATVVIDSVPLGQAHHQHHHHGKSMSPSSTNKRLRLFGVNMECSSPPMQQEDEEEAEQCQILSSTVASLSPHQHQHHHQYHHLQSSSSSSLSQQQQQPLELRPQLPNYGGAPLLPLPGSADHRLLSEKGKSTSLSFYLDP